jgi:class 3 adenylate cyclase
LKSFLVEPPSRSETMLLFFTAFLSASMGCFVGVAGQERRVKIWFFLLCASTASLCIGLWMEVNAPNWAVLAARANMTSALMIAAMGLLSARAMCGWRLNTAVVILLALASVVDIVTVWITDLYLTGGIYHYSWGTYAAGNRLFVVTPALIIVVALFGIFALWENYRDSHPLERNRAKYLLLANLFLLFAALDFLPHFGINTLAGPVSGIAIPLFLATYSYAMLRYRLVEFRSFVSRATGWFLAGVSMATIYALTVEIGKRIDAPLEQTYLISAIAGFLAWLGAGRYLPDLAQRVLSQESDFRYRVQLFGDEIVSIQDERVLSGRLLALCIEEFGASSAKYIENSHASPIFQGGIFSNEDIIEREARRRSGQLWPDFLLDAEVIFPLVRRETILGIVSIGNRTDGEQYTHGMLVALRHAANIFFVTVANLRSAQELEKRHQLDRYLAPQIVESILAGRIEIISERRRRPITVFFSDLKDFGLLADKIDPTHVAIILNEYLSAMAEIAFKFGGTLDKFIGDSIMVIFGAPLDSDPSMQVNQCVRMALAMQSRIKELNQKWLERRLLVSQLTCRMGIHIGEATVGSFGSDNRVEYTAIGRNVNLASRLEGHCTPGHVLVSSECLPYLSGDFQGRLRCAIQLKGFADPVDAYEIDSDPAKPTSLLYDYGGDRRTETTGIKSFSKA